MTQCAHQGCTMPTRVNTHREGYFFLVEIRCLNGHSYWPEQEGLDPRACGTMVEPLRSGWFSK